MTVPIPAWLLAMEAGEADPVAARCARIKYLLHAASLLLDPNRGRLDTLAARLECTEALLFKISQPSRDQKITPEMAIKIEKMTGGEVTRAMLRPDLYL